MDLERGGDVVRGEKQGCAAFVGHEQGIKAQQFAGTADRFLDRDGGFVNP